MTGDDFTINLKKKAYSGGLHELANLGICVYVLVYVGMHARVRACMHACVCLGGRPSCIRINNLVYHVRLCLANRFPLCQAR